MARPGRPPNLPGYLPPWVEPFLAALRICPVVSDAAAKAGVSRANAYLYRQNNPAFAEAWDDAIEEGVDRVEQAAFQRATTGWEEPVYYQGEIVGYVTKFSDKMAEVILKGRRKSVYAERREITGGGGGAVTIVSGVPEAEDDPVDDGAD